MLPFLCMYLPKVPNVEYGYVGTCGFENINKFILTHICQCFVNAVAIRWRQNQNLLHFCLKYEGVSKSFEPQAFSPFR